MQGLHPLGASVQFLGDSYLFLGGLTGQMICLSPALAFSSLWDSSTRHSVLIQGGVHCIPGSVSLGTYRRDFTAIKMTFVPLVMSCIYLLVLSGPRVIQAIILLCYLFELLFSCFWPFSTWLVPFLLSCILMVFRLFSKWVCHLWLKQWYPFIFSHLNISILSILFFTFSLKL